MPGTWCRLLLCFHVLVIAAMQVDRENSVFARLGPHMPPSTRLQVPSQPDAEPCNGLLKCTMQVDYAMHS